MASKKVSQELPKGFEFVVFAQGERPSEFWLAMGPYFASEKVHKALPTLHDEPRNDVWFLGVVNGQLESFSCLRFTARGDSATLAHHWANEPKRDAGIAALMLDVRIDYARDAGVKSLRSVVHNDSVPAFRRRGFVPTIERAHFTTMEIEF